jgi:hypothetical protein
LREGRPSIRNAEDPDAAGEARIAALQTSVEALVAELQRSAAAEPRGGVLEEDRRALADAVERLSAAAEMQGAATRSAIEGLEAALREGGPSIRSAEDLDAAGEAQTAALQTSIEALVAELRRGAAAEPRAAGLETALRELALSTRTAIGSGGAGNDALQAAVEALTAELRQSSALIGAVWEASSAARRTANPADVGRELRQLLEEI